MKKVSVLASLLCLVLFLLCCGKKDLASSPQTSLYITVKDQLGNNITAASIKIYETESDYLNKRNAVGSAATDIRGLAIFSGLLPIKYYFSVEKDCLTNMFGGVVTDARLVQGQRHNVTCVVDETGTLNIRNNSVNPYDVYLNGELLIQAMPGNSSETYVAKKGFQQIRVIQKSGYLITPTDKTYTGNISCNTVLNCTFP